MTKFQPHIAFNLIASFQFTEREELNERRHDIREVFQIYQPSI